MQKLEPARARSRGRQCGTDPSIPNRLIEPFLSQPMIVSAEDLAKYPRNRSHAEDRVYLGRGDQAYARGIEDRSLTDFHIFRPARAAVRAGRLQARQTGRVRSVLPGQWTGGPARRGHDIWKITDSRAEKSASRNVWCRSSTNR